MRITGGGSAGSARGDRQRRRIGRDAVVRQGVVPRDIVRSTEQEQRSSYPTRDRILGLAFGDQDHVLDPHASASPDVGHPDERFDGEDHARLLVDDRRAGQRLSDVRGLVRSHADPVADEQAEQVVAEAVLAQPSR